MNQRFICGLKVLCGTSLETDCFKFPIRYYHLWPIGLICYFDLSINTNACGNQQCSVNKAIRIEVVGLKSHLRAYLTLFSSHRKVLQQLQLLEGRFINIISSPPIIPFPAKHLSLLSTHHKHCTLRSDFKVKIHQTENTLLLAVKILFIFMHCSNCIRKLSLLVSYTSSSIKNTYLLVSRQLFVFSEHFVLSISM